MVQLVVDLVVGGDASRQITATASYVDESPTASMQSDTRVLKSVFVDNVLSVKSWEPVDPRLRCQMIEFILSGFMEDARVAPDSGVVMDLIKAASENCHFLEDKTTVHGNLLHFAMAMSSKCLVVYLLRNNPRMVEEVDYQSQLPLHHMQDSLINTLLDALQVVGTKQLLLHRDNFGATPLCAMIAQGYVQSARMFIKCMLLFPWDSMVFASKNSLLHYICACCDLDTLESITNRQLVVSSKFFVSPNESGHLPVHLLLPYVPLFFERVELLRIFSQIIDLTAAENGKESTNTMKTILYGDFCNKLKQEIRKTNLSMELHFLASQGSQALLSLYLDVFPKEMDIPDENGMTALSYAILAKQNASAKILLDRGADPVLMDKVDNCPLVYAILHDCIWDIILSRVVVGKKLLKKSVNAVVVSRNLLALKTIVGGNSRAVREVAIEIEKMCMNSVQLAFLTGDLIFYKAFCQMIGIAPNSNDEIQCLSESLLLHSVAASTSMDVESNSGRLLMLYLFEQNITTDKFGNTLIHFVTANGSLPVLRWLLTDAISKTMAEKMLHQQSQDGLVPIHMAVLAHDLEKVVFIHGITNTLQSTTWPLQLIHLAAAESCHDIAHWLIGKNVDINYLDYHRRQHALYFAIRSGDERMIKILIDNGAVLYYRSQQGISTIAFAYFAARSTSDVVAAATAVKKPETIDNASKQSSMRGFFEYLKRHDEWLALKASDCRFFGEMVFYIVRYGDEDLTQKLIRKKPFWLNNALIDAFEFMLGLPSDKRLAATEAMLSFAQQCSPNNSWISGQNEFGQTIPHLYVHHYFNTCRDDAELDSIRILVERLPTETLLKCDKKGQTFMHYALLDPRGDDFAEKKDCLSARLLLIWNWYRSSNNALHKAVVQCCTLADHSGSTPFHYLAMYCGAYLEPFHYIFLEALKIDCWKYFKFDIGEQKNNDGLLPVHVAACSPRQPIPKELAMHIVFCSSEGTRDPPDSSFTVTYHRNYSIAGRTAQRSMIVVDRAIGLFYELFAHAAAHRNLADSVASYTSAMNKAGKSQRLSVLHLALYNFSITMNDSIMDYLSQRCDAGIRNDDEMSAYELALHISKSLPRTVIKDGADRARLASIIARYYRNATIEASGKAVGAVISATFLVGGIAVSVIFPPAALMSTSAVAAVCVTALSGGLIGAGLQGLFYVASAQRFDYSAWGVKLCLGAITGVISGGMQGILGHMISSGYIATAWVNTARILTNAASGGITGFVMTYVNCSIATGNWGADSIREGVFAAVVGAFSGAIATKVDEVIQGMMTNSTLSCTFKKVAITGMGMAAASVTGGLTSVIIYAIRTENFNGNEAFEQFWNGAKSAAFSFAISEGIRVMQSSLCFVQGTLVHTGDGLLPIQDIRVGHHVWSWNEAKQTNELKPVLHTFVNHVPPDSIMKLTTATEIIVCTAQHLFWIAGVGWKAAVMCQPNDSLLSMMGTLVPIRQIQPLMDDTAGDKRSLLNEEHLVSVFNFEVADNHTYFVSESAVVTHNRYHHVGERVPDGGHIDRPQSREEFRQGRDHIRSFMERIHQGDNGWTTHMLPTNSTTGHSIQLGDNWHLDRQHSQNGRVTWALQHGSRMFASINVPAQNANVLTYLHYLNKSFDEGVQYRLNTVFPRR